MGLLPSSVQGDVLMSAFRGGCLVQVFDNDGVPRAHVEAIRFDAFAKEEGNGLFIADLHMLINLDALTVPEVIKILLAEPFLGSLSVELVLGLEKDTLVVLDVGLKLIVVCHGLSKETIFVP